MTIRLLEAFNGIPASAVVTLDAPTEAALLSRLKASSNLAGGFLWGQNNAFQGGQFPSRSIAIEDFGAYPGAARKDIDSAIIRALAFGGPISLTTPGSYDCSFGYSAVSDSYIRIGAGVTLKQSRASQRFFLSNQNAFSIAATASGNITAAAVPSSARVDLATIPFASPQPFVPGTYIQVFGDTTNSYNGIWRVVSTSGNNVQFLMPRLASRPASSGTIKVAAANANITVEVQGILDHNEIENSTINGPADSSFFFSRIGNLKVIGANVINSPKIAVSFCNSWHAIVQNIYVESGSACIQMGGNIFNTIIDGVRGYTGDDCVAWTGGVGGSPDLNYLGVPDAVGPCNGLAIKNVWMHEIGSRAVLIAPGTGADAARISIDDVHCDKQSAVLVLLDCGGTDTATIEDVTIRNISGAQNSSTQNWDCVTVGVTSGPTLTVNNLEVENLRNANGSTGITQNAVNLGVSARVKNARVITPSVRFNANGTANFSLFQVVGGGQCENVEILEPDLDSYGTNVRAYVVAYSDSASVLTNARMIGGRYKGFGQLVSHVNPTRTRYQIVGAPVIEAAQGFVGGDQGFDVVIDSPTFVTSLNAPIFNLYGTSKIYNISFGNIRDGGFTGWGYGTTNTINLLSSDGSIGLDASKFTISNGCIFNNTNAGFGVGAGTYAKGPTTATRIAA